MADGKSDYVCLDIFQRTQIAILGVKLHASTFSHRTTWRRLAIADDLSQLGEIVSSQGIAFTEHRRAEQHSLQLADIAWPIERAKQAQRI